jgi:hypothetical protein
MPERKKGAEEIEGRTEKGEVNLRICFQQLATFYDGAESITCIHFL